MPIFSSNRRRVAVALSLAPLAARAQPQFQPQPAVALPKVITLIVPQAAGGSNDAFARAVAARLPRFIDANVVVENRVGANGNIGSAWVARSAPRDGSVWLATVNSTQTINPALYSKPGFDPIADFEPVAGIAVVQHVVVVNSGLPVQSLGELVALARREPGKHSYASSGNGTFSHLLMEMLKRSMKVQLVHVPYRGIAPALTDLVGGQLQCAISTVPAAMPFIRTGQLRPIAVTSLARSPALPQVPLAHEMVPGMVGELWIAIYAPRGTPRQAIEQMHAAVARVQALPDMEATMAAQGAAPLRAAPAELLAMTQAELAKWAPIVKESGMTID